MDSEVTQIMGLLSLLILISFPSHSEMKTSLVTEGVSFVSQDYEATSNKSFGMIGARLVSEAESKDLLFMNVTGLYAVGQSSLSYLDLKELSLNFSVDKTSQVYVGRRLNNWTKMDDQWNLGLIQPQFRWNTLNPENQGLTGLFWTREETHFKIKLFGSPLYLPDQGPSYEIKDGQFSSSNPWYSNPPQNISFQGGPILPIDYNVDVPETSEVIFQSSYGAQIQLGGPEGFYSQLSGLYKPANQLALGYRVVGVVDRVRVDVVPKVYYETTFAADAGYKKQDFDLSVSVLYSKPTSPTFDPGYNAPVFAESTTAALLATYNAKPFKFGIGFLDTSGGAVTEIGPDAGSTSRSLSEKPGYKQAYQVEAGFSRIFAAQYKIETSFNYKESTKEPFRLITFKSRLNVRGPWAFWLNAILVDTDENSESYFESFRNRDMVVVGASYDI